MQNQQNRVSIEWNEHGHCLFVNGKRIPRMNRMLLDADEDPQVWILRGVLRKSGWSPLPGLEGCTVVNDEIVDALKQRGFTVFLGDIDFVSDPDGAKVTYTRS